jgi:hypothetical protein
VAVIALFLMAVVLGFTQTKLFRSYLRTRLVQMVTNDLHGELTLGTLEGNLVTGFQLDNVVLLRSSLPDFSSIMLFCKKTEIRSSPSNGLMSNMIRSASSPRVQRLPALY